MPKAIKKKIAKKTTSAETDVKDRLVSLRDMIKNRQKTAMKYAGVFLVIIVAVGGLLVYSVTSRNKARMFENEGYSIYYNNNKEKFMNKKDQYQKALDMFEKAYNMRKSPLSLFYIAGCYYELGNYDDALKRLRDFVRIYSNDPTFIPLAYQKMVMIYVRKGDVNNAMKTLDAISNMNGAIFKDFALIEYARLLEKEGKPEKAIEKYGELTSKFPNSPFVEEAKAKLSPKKES
jgi:tetratricopeptide (TPR) repeat protein